MVAGSPGRRAEAELLLFLGRGPLHRGVLQQLMHTEFSFPGEQKDWYPAEAMRQAAEDAQDLRYMIPATQTQGSRLACAPCALIPACPPSSHSPKAWRGRKVLCFTEPPKIHEVHCKEGSHHFTTFDRTVKLFEMQC